MSAIIITGGSPSSKSVEILRENGSYWCSLPDLPDSKLYHSQSGLILCSFSVCLSFIKGQWVTSHQLQYSRYYHSSWMSHHGVVLMGGAELGGATTEILNDNGGSTPSFALKHDTR